VGYIDPGSGALIWQFLMAAFLGSLFFAKKFFSFITFRKRRKNDDQKSDAAE